jgi:serine/threonine-protein kinase
MGIVNLDGKVARRLRDTVRQELLRRFGETCVARGFLTEEQLRRGLAEQESARSRGDAAPLGQVLVRLGYLTPERTLEVLDGLLRPEEAPDAALPRRLGRYELLAEAGRGGIGTVYKARDLQLDRPVAVKTLRRDLLPSPEHVTALAREARAAARLHHPNIVTVYDGGEIDGVPFVSMEYVEGASLASVLAERRLSLGALVAVLHKAAEAVGYAHQQGLVHRDLKPGNILVDARGEPRVIDFGVAKLVDREAFLAATGPAGTPYYMSPEQIRDPKGVDARSDVYALGVCLYQMMTGRMPFEGNDVYPLFQRILHEEAPPPRSLRPDLPRDLETICRKAMERDPARRYAGARELAEDLARYLAGEPIAARPPGAGERILRRLSRHRARLAAGSAALLAVLAVAWGVRSAERERLQRYRAFQEELKPLEALVHETRPLFYVKGAEVAPRLGRIQTLLEALEKKAAGAAGRDAWKALGLGWELVGDLPRAEAALLRAAAEAPEDGAVRLALGRILLQRSLLLVIQQDGAPEDDRRGRARALSERALGFLRNRDPSWGGAQEIDRHLAGVYRALAEGDGAAVHRLCEEGLARFGRAMGAEEYHFLAGAARPAEAALASFTRALEWRPHYPLACLLRGNAWRERGDLDRAIEDYSSALALNGRLASAFNDRGVVRWKRGELDPAAADFDQALRLEPDHVYARLNRAAVRLQQSDLGRARADADRAVATNPGLALAYVQRGAIRQAQGDLDGAAEDYEAAIARGPGLAAAHCNRAGLRAARKDFDPARADYDRAIELGPSWEAYAGRAFVRLSQDDREGAIEDYDRAIGLNPRHGPSYFYRGSARAELDRSDEALADFSEAIRLAPSFAAAYVARGVVREGRGEHEEALRDYAAALQIEPRSPDALFNRGVTYLHLRKFREAAADLERSLEVAPAGWNSRALAEEHLSLARQGLKPE